MSARPPGAFDEAMARGFLQALYGDLPESHRLLLAVFFSESKRFYWCDGIDELLDIAAHVIASQADLYLGCGTQPPGLTVHEKGTAATVLGIPGVWADLDVAGPEHKNDRLCPDRASALIWARALDPAPNFIVDSGHGFHLWWRFEQFWAFDADPLGTDVARAAAAQLTRDWLAWLRAQAPAWELDGTANLDRLLRLPGSWNWKSVDDPRPVEIVS